MRCTILKVCEGVELCVTCGFLYVNRARLSTTMNRSFAGVSDDVMKETVILAVRKGFERRGFGAPVVDDGTVVPDGEPMPSDAPEDYDLL